MGCESKQEAREKATRILEVKGFDPRRSKTRRGGMCWSSLCTPTASMGRDGLKGSD